MDFWTTFTFQSTALFLGLFEVGSRDLEMAVEIWYTSGSLHTRTLAQLRYVILVELYLMGSAGGFIKNPI